MEVRADALDRERRALTSVVAFDRETLDAVPALGEQDPIRTLELLPGVQTASDVSSGLYVRGGGPDQTLVMLDEVTVYNPTHAFGIFSTFNADVVDQVRLYKGAFPARFGGRIGAVLDVRNRSQEVTQLQGRGGISTITGRLLLEGPVAGGTLMASGRRTYLEPILDAVSTESSPLPSYYFYDFNGRFSRPTRSGQFHASAYLGQDDLFFDLDEDSFLDIEWGNLTYSGKYAHVFNANVTGSLLLSGSEYDSRTKAQIFTTPIVVQNRLRDASVRGDLVWTAGESHRVIAGAVGSWYEFEYRETFNLTEQTQFRSQPTDLSVFLEDEWTLDGGSIYGGGVRVRRFSEGNRWLVEPRVTGSWPIGENKRFKLGGGLYHQYLQLVSTEGFSAGDFYLPVDSSSPPPRSIQAVGGFEWRPTRTYDVTIEAYYTELADLLTLNNKQSADREYSAASDAFTTGGRGFATGLEFFLQRRLGALTGWVGYGLGWTRREFDEVNGGRRYAPKYDRRHDLNLVGNYRRGKWRYGASFTYATGQAFTPATARYDLRDPATGAPQRGGRLLPGEKNSARLLPYHRLDVSVTRDFKIFGRPAEGYLQVFNLYNRRNEWFVQFDPTGKDIEPSVVRMLPTIPSLGLRFTF